MSGDVYVDEGGFLQSENSDGGYKSRASMLKGIGQGQGGRGPGPGGKASAEMGLLEGAVDATGLRYLGQFGQFDWNMSLLEEVRPMILPSSLLLVKTFIVLFCVLALRSPRVLRERCREPIDMYLHAFSGHAVTVMAVTLWFMASVRNRPRSLQTTSLASPRNRKFMWVFLALAGLQGLLAVFAESQFAGLGIGGHAPMIQCAVTAPTKFATARWVGAYESWVFVVLFAVIGMWGG